MKVLFACGGTGGHINPALAVAGYIKEKEPESVIAFVGNKTGMEATLVKKAGYKFYPIKVAGFQRGLTPKKLMNDVRAVGLAVSAGKDIKKILSEFKPDVVMGTGGYVSGPVLRKAHKMGYKTATHEQNAYPGITTKMLSRYVDTVMLAMPQAKRYLPERIYVDTGNPVRLSVIKAKKESSRKALGLDERPMILSYGGSLGAKRINEVMADVIAEDLKDGKYRHFHAMGSYGAKWMPELLKSKGVDISDENLKLYEYIDNMDVMMSAADLVICRSGAITLSELEVQGKPSILIPSPNVAENHQYHNAMTLVERGAAAIIEEKDLTPERLKGEIDRLLSDGEELLKMSVAAKKMAVINSNERIFRALKQLAKNKRL